MNRPARPVGATSTRVHTKAPPFRLGYSTKIPGYSGARFYALWNPELGLDEKVLHSHLAREVAKGATPELKECGACGDCRGGAGPLLPRAGRVCGRQSAKTGNANYQRPGRQARLAGPSRK